MHPVSNTLRKLKTQNINIYLIFWLHPYNFTLKCKGFQSPVNQLTLHMRRARKMECRLIADPGEIRSPVWIINFLDGIRKEWMACVAPGQINKDLVERNILYSEEKNKRIIAGHPYRQSCSAKFDGYSLSRTNAHWKEQAWKSVQCPSVLWR